MACETCPEDHLKLLLLMRLLVGRHVLIMGDVWSAAPAIFSRDLKTRATSFSNANCWGKRGMASEPARHCNPLGCTVEYAANEVASAHYSKDECAGNCVAVPL